MLELYGYFLLDYNNFAWKQWIAWLNKETNKIMWRHSALLQCFYHELQANNSCLQETTLCSNAKISSSIIRNAWFPSILLITPGKQMSNSSAPCFNKIYFVLITSCNWLTDNFSFTSVTVWLWKIVKHCQTLSSNTRRKYPFFKLVPRIDELQTLKPQ